MGLALVIGFVACNAAIAPILGWLGVRAGRYESMAAWWRS